MNKLPITVADGFVQYYESLGESVHILAGPLSEEQFWKNPFPYGNSFGHLVLHITGNLNYYIGAQIAMNGYVRDRDREFTETVFPPKEETLKRLDEVVKMVTSSLKNQSVDDWSKDYTAVGEEDAGNRFNIVLRCASHFYHHIGQMIYLAEEISREESNAK